MAPPDPPVAGDGRPEPTSDANGRPEDDLLGPDLRASRLEKRLGDFTTSAQVLRLLPFALVIGALGAVTALVLLDLIGFITNLAYYHRLSLKPVSPLANTLGPISIVVPVVGGAIVGLMARFGSERIRGHGIPEAMETILVGGSKVEPRLTVLKPISSAISIGTGGPFGAEGPIILTGGALGSVIAQFFHLSAIERRTLLVAGAAAGMSAVFGTPVAAVILAVELLLFEWKPRSMVMVAAASAVADAIRLGFAHASLISAAPLFPVPHVRTGFEVLLGAVALGLAAGGASWVLTKAVYGAEDLFTLLPFHWSWWPLLGGLVVGIGGLIEPRALGVGYDTIAAELVGRLLVATLVALLLVKLVIWAVALGSGTSGGILAPILMMGAALGALAGHVLPGGNEATWAVLGMAAVMGGVMRSPFTAVIFAVELTHDVDLLLPLMIVATAAHLISVLTLKRSILTEKVARRGFHVLREYGVEPLEALFVRDVMATEVLTVEPERSIREVYELLGEGPRMRRQRLVPVLSPEGGVAGAVLWGDVLELVARGDARAPIGTLMRERDDLPEAFGDESLRDVADRMAARRVDVMAVVERDRPDRLVGVVTQFDLLRARERQLQEERHRERVLRLRRVGRRAL
ncbi:MAG TPA: chloride channel protein [Actinomycetota bacterium]|nr:chloride channel protein [Actinomycetota bacterium]